MSLGDFKAYPIAGAENRIVIAGTVDSTRSMTLVGVDTPYGPAELTATIGCVGRGLEWMSQLQIEPGDSMNLAVGRSGYLVVRSASGLPAQGSEMPVTLRFSDAPDMTAYAQIRPAEHAEAPANTDGNDCSS
jgi:hypothetical protein